MGPAHLVTLAVPALTVVDPTPGGGRMAEVSLSRLLMGGHGGFLNGRLRIHAMLSLEGWTIPDGEPSPGAWGEGPIDRRHPHTYAHELIATLTTPGDRSWQLGVAAGKGFVGFGSDDPTLRAPYRFPVNHHLAQILERALLLGQVRAGPVVVEGTLFNGDEPERPGQWPNLDRFGDSRAIRVLIRPAEGIELQGSRGRVRSPEHRSGAGLDQDKWSASGRWEGRAGPRPLLLFLEWAETDELDGAVTFRSILGEGVTEVGPHRLYYRFERTSRPEEERVEPSRSRRPHLEDAIHGVSRWTAHTVGWRLELRSGSVWSVEPFLEGSGGRVAKVGTGVFDVSSWYARAGFWSVSAGVRIGAGTRSFRMGRYGVLDSPEGTGVTDHR